MVDEGGAKVMAPSIVESHKQVKAESIRLLLFVASALRQLRSEGRPAVVMAAAI